MLIDRCLSYRHLAQAELSLTIQARWLLSPLASTHRHNRVHSFKYPAIAAAIARYSLLRQSAAICVHL